MNQEKAKKYFDLVKFMADTFSKDPHKKVGCLLLAPESLQILSMGYNGFPRGVDETPAERWSRPTKYYYVEHSERNCLYNACRSGVNTNGSIAVTTLYPCSDCCRALIQSGIKTIITTTPDFSHERWGEDFKYSRIMFEEAHVDVILLDSSQGESKLLMVGNNTRLES
jgi:dCMP deaminase